ncbi:hypothetical protein PYW08_005233 [Mythimna loreyi]|uniref:Uncharacterized protein n=1 Tax=Mythimna loreyi TaxID=667449 RepID=A0ACC2QFG7_9NEOP|nr:hypothetical protein PYW08_005233 [Mythimna loreyi]
MNKIFFVLFFVACFSLFAEAQLTFTSSWGGGKRSGVAPISCKNEEAVATIFKLIQNEAERFIICQQKP